MFFYKFSNNTIYSALSSIITSNKKYEKNVLLPFTNSTFDLVNLLIRAKEILGIQIKIMNTCYFILISLCYPENRPKLFNLCFISKPGRRIYINLYFLRKMMLIAPASTFILHSSHGLISGTEAVLLNTGGELLCILN